MIEDAPVERALERVLPEWRLFDVTLCACMPSRRHLPARNRAFVDFLRQFLVGGDRDPWLSAAGCKAVFGTAQPRLNRLRKTIGFKNDRYVIE